jgi:Skp family chaperone for outer membrane proteins
VRELARSAFAQAKPGSDVRVLSIAARDEGRIGKDRAMTDGRFDRMRGSTTPAIAGGGVRDAARAQFPDRAERRVSPRAWLVAGVAAIAVALVSGAGVFAGASGEDAARLKSIEASIAERQKALAALDEERKGREDALADVQRRANAKESELAEASERVAALEERRGALQRQVAELAGPVSPSDEGSAVVADDAAAEPADLAPQPVTAPIPEARDPGPSPTRQAGLSDSAEPRDARSAEGGGERREAASLAAVDGRAPAARMASAEASSAAVDEAARDIAAAGPVRVFIHVRSSDQAARNRARAVAAELRRRGVSVAEIRGVRLPVRRDSVRFFYDADRTAVPELQEAVRDASSSAGAPPVAQDYRSYGAPPRPGTIELWLS